MNEIWSRHHRQMAEGDGQVASVQFTVRGFLVATAATAVVFALLKLLPLKLLSPKLFSLNVVAAVLGVSVLVGMTFISTGFPKPRFVRLLVWLLLALYLLVAMTAAFQSG